MLDTLQPSFTAQIARVAAMDSFDLERVQHEVLAAPIRWITEYSDYQSGGWWTSSLLNESGDASDVLIRDCEPRPTDLLAMLPKTQQLLNSLGLRMMWVRLARLAPNSFLWEHRDYGELNSAEKHRLHIPLSTNSSAYLVVGGARVHLAPGAVWRLTPTFEHGVCNMHGPDRVHLVIDCYADEGFRQLTAAASLLESDVTPLPAIGRSALDDQIGTARRLLGLGYKRAAESHLLRLFYRFALGTGTVYDLIIELYESSGFAEDATSWRAKKLLLLGGCE